MSEIRRETLPVRCAELCGESTLPLLADIRVPGEPADFAVDEDDGLFLNYSVVRTAFPYRMQDCYSRELTRDGIDAVVLENEFLRASFVPELGGKLWSLYDKKAERELLFSNHVFRPAYLALRNAWTSGGIEWNCGAFTGHHPHTCSPMFTYLISSEESGLGCPVLRMYNYERIRGVTWQMDFYLPDGSPVLHCRMRVKNENLVSTDMYWWSNIAVPGNPDARNIVPADEAFTPVGGKISKIPILSHNEKDITYPHATRPACDYFYKTYEDSRRYTTVLGRDGYGLFETSTRRLRGRKLFVWGTGQGSDHWQEFLSGDDGRGNFSDGKYYEIQCGLANTQYECIPMPPQTAWEWMEYYGAAQVDPEKIFGEWKTAQKAVGEFLDGILPETVTEEELSRTRNFAKTAHGEKILSSEGWAALENRRREKNGLSPMSPHLDFGEIPSGLSVWESLLETGSVGEGEEIPRTYQRDPAWEKPLKAACEGKDRDSWYAHYELGCLYLSRCAADDAEKELLRAEALSENAFVLYARAERARIAGDIGTCAVLARRAAEMQPDDPSFAKIAAKYLCMAKMWDEVLAFTDGLPQKTASGSRIRLSRAAAFFGKGDLVQAEKILYEAGGLNVPDMQEGEVSVTGLWYDIEEEKAKREGRTFDRSIDPPRRFDFRMS